MLSLLLFVIGAVVLIVAAQRLTRYLVGTAAGLGVSLFLLAIIFTGIEFDDLAVGITLNNEELEEAALGTVLGTATAMSGVVLAIACLFVPRRINIPRDYTLIFVASPIVLAIFVLTGDIGLVSGILLFALFVVFVGYVAARELRRSSPVFRDAELFEEIVDATGTTDIPRRGRPPFRVNVPFTQRELPGWAGLVLAIVSLVFLIVGAVLLGDNTPGVLDLLGIGETVFGATILTLVLSLEDLFLTVGPTRRGAPEIGIGNVIGSVIFGVTGKLGIVVLAGGAITVDDDVLAWHLPVFAVITWFAAYAIWSGRLRRWHGAVLLVAYIAYWVISFAAFGGAPIEIEGDDDDDAPSTSQQVPAPVPSAPVLVPGVPGGPAAPSAVPGAPAAGAPSVQAPPAQAPPAQAPPAGDNDGDDDDDDG